MNLLGFDTSTAATAACVLRADGESFEVLPPAAALAAPPAHARELMPAVAEVMERSGLRFDELTGIAVGIGPGTFTGLRIGLATARALASANGLALRPVSSLAALAAGIEAAQRLPLIDARRAELFAALHEDGRALIGPFVARPAEVVARVRQSGCRPLAAGDGSLRFREALERAGVEVAPAESEQHVVRGVHVCRLGLTAEAARPEAVLPDYLRLPDARPAR